MECPQSGADIKPRYDPQGALDLFFFSSPFLCATAMATPLACNPKEQPVTKH
jgi:hypothetical protein